MIQGVTMTQETEIPDPAITEIAFRSADGLISVYRSNSSGLGDIQIPDSAEEIPVEAARYLQTEAKGAIESEVARLTEVASEDAQMKRTNAVAALAEALSVEPSLIAALL